MKIAIITSGGAGMFCGSCMQDNTLARTLRMAGQDAVLVPTYTPIRVDEENVSGQQVFMGGLNVYLDSAIPGWRYLPAWMTKWLDNKSIVSALSRLSSSTDASKLGSLTLDMLRGTHGPQRREVRSFCSYLCDDLQPDVIIFSNALLSGVLTALRDRFAGPILCLLQGDDIYLEALSDKWKPRVMAQLTDNVRAFDGFLVHSQYYRKFMADYLQLPDTSFRTIPLTIDTVGTTTDSKPHRTSSVDRRIGYFARICPEKGVHNLLQAAMEVLPEFPRAEVAIGGFLPEQHRHWFERLLADAAEATAGRIHWCGSPDSRAAKFDLLKTFDVLCVPTDYHEPKGLYVLEAAAIDIPALVPDHGAFPELIERLDHGTLYEASAETGLATAMRRLLSDELPATDGLAERVEAVFGMQSTGPQLVTAVESFQSRD